jgi:hypothetical protein
VCVQELVAVTQDLQFTRRNDESRRAHTFDTASPSRSMLCKRSPRAVLVRSVSLPTPMASMISTQYPGKN